MYDTTDSGVIIFGKIIFLIILIYFSIPLLTTARPWIFLDGVNLLFHEAGHLIFMVLGQFMSMIGGSLTQLIIPIVIGIYFLRQEQYFSFAFSLFWLGDNLVSVAIYMADARSMTLDLIMGGGIHDWNWVFDHTGLLTQDQIIGGFFRFLGSVCILAGIGLMGYLVFRTIYTKLKSR
jgi:hypothetical protein